MHQRELLFHRIAHQFFCVDHLWWSTLYPHLEMEGQQKYTIYSIITKKMINNFLYFYHFLQPTFASDWVWIKFINFVFSKVYLLILAFSNIYIAWTKRIKMRISHFWIGLRAGQSKLVSPACRMCSIQSRCKKS